MMLEKLYKASSCSFV